MGNQTSHVCQPDNRDVFQIVNDLNPAAIIFDFDGTLFDTQEANYQAYKLAFKKRGLEFRRATYRTVFGQKWSMWGPKLAGGYSDEIHRIKKNCYENFISEVTAITPYTNLAMEMFYRSTTVLMTNASPKCVQVILEKHPIRFHYKFFGCDFSNRRDMLAAVILTLKVPQHLIMLIDDLEENLLTARKLGICTHLVQR